MHKIKLHKINFGKIDFSRILRKKQRTPKEKHKEKNEEKYKVKPVGNNKSLHIRNSIALRLIISFMIPICFVIITGFASYNKASKSIVQKYRESSLQTISMTSEYFRLGFSQVEASSTQYILDDTIARYAAGKLKTMDAFKAKLSIKKVFLAKTMSDEFISNIHVIPKKADVVSTAFQSGTDMYKEFLQSKTGKKISDSTLYWIGNDDYLDKKFNINQSKYGIRYIKGFGSTKAYIIIDIKSSAIEKELDSNKYGAGSIVGFVTVDGRELFSSASKINKNTKQIFSKESFYQKAMKGSKNSGSMNVTYKGTKYLYLYSKIGTTDAMVCTLIPQANIVSQVKGIKNVTIILVVISCLIAILIGTFISTKIQNTIRYFIMQMKTVASGDLTVKLKVKRKDEFMALSNGINEMIDKMRGLIEKVNVQSNSVTHSSEKVMNASNVFTGSTQGIFESIKEIQTGVAQQAEDAENCLTQMDSLSGKIQVVSGKTKEISEIASETKDSVTAGINSMGTLNEKANETAKITEEIIDHIEVLEEKSKSIGKIVGTINEIASQTTLLSLNASIEAARAGVYGRGFSVVAEEIGKLSEQSVRAVKEIENIIKEIQSQTKSAVIIANKADKVVADQEGAVKDTEQSFQNLYGNVEKLISNVGLITESITNIDTARIGTLSAIENISAVSQQTAAEAVTVYNSTNEQLDVVHSLSDLSKELDDNAQALDNVVHQFILS